MHFRFSIAGRDGGIDARHPLWSRPLPTGTRPGGTDGPPVTHGAYFNAVQSYLQDQGLRQLGAARAAGAWGRRVGAIPDRIDVVLEKHGAFYHPARIVWRDSKAARPFVLNVAITPAAIQWMNNEVASLEDVAPRLPADALPRVHGRGEVTDADGHVYGMFLADWFEDYHEFHLSQDAGDGRQKIIVWDTRKTPYYLAPAQTRDLYRQTAHLLARAYDPRSTRQIYPWHHASGDFVLRQRANRLDLKLITVRQYAPTLSAEAGGPLEEAARQMGVLAFLANLSLRNRIDRLDGTGDLAWAGDEAVAATVAGVKQAAVETDHLGFYRRSLQGYDQEDWVALLTAAGEQYRLMAAEADFIRPRIPGHAALLVAAVQREFCD